MGAKVEAARLPALGSCFFLAWMNGAFFTSILQGKGASAALSSSYWSLSLTGVFCGLVLLVVLEGWLGEVCSRLGFVRVATLCVCAGTVLMMVGVTGCDDGAFLGGVGSFMTGLSSSVFYLAWSVVYGRMEPEDSEIAIPLSVAASQLLGIALGSLRGVAAEVALVVMPLASLACLSRCLAIPPSFDAGKERTTELPPSSRKLPPVVGWRCGLLAAAVWFVLSLITAMVKRSESDAFVESYLLPFVVSFVALLVLLMAYVMCSRRVSLFGASRIVFCLMVISLVALLIVPGEQASAAFLFARTAAMFFWAVLWAMCSRVVREEGLTATRVVGSMRAWIQGGAALSILAALVMGADDLHGAACLGLVVLSLGFCVALPAYARPGEEPALRDDRAGEDGSPSSVDDRCASTSLSFEERCRRLCEAHGLSPRESEVAECLLRGRNLPYIRETLYISRNTINTHIRHIYAKMGIHSKQELIDEFERMAGTCGGPAEDPSDEGSAHES